MVYLHCLPKKCRYLSNTINRNSKWKDITGYRHCTSSQNLWSDVVVEWGVRLLVRRLAKQFLQSCTSMDEGSPTHYRECVDETYKTSTKCVKWRKYTRFIQAKICVLHCCRKFCAKIWNLRICVIHLVRHVVKQITMEITLSWLAAANELRPALVRLHDGDWFCLYHVKNAFGLQQSKYEVF